MYSINKFNKKRKIKRNKYLLKNIFFLRKLYIRKNRVLIKKNLIINFIFYRKLKNTFFYNLNNFTYNLFKKSLSNNVEVLPVFFISKKIFFNHTNFNFFLKNNNLNFLYVKNYDKNQEKIGSKVFVFEKSLNLKPSFDKSKLIDLFNNSIEKKDNIVAFNKSSIINKFFTINDFLNCFFNYNIYIINSIELYKILILLYFNKIN